MKVSKFFVEKKMSMLTGLKVSSVACKCVNVADQNIIQKGEGAHGTEL